MSVEPHGLVLKLHWRLLKLSVDTEGMIIASSRVSQKLHL